ncbi:MAG: N-formylglutamate amidohydrolase [Rhodobacter sp.]|nr:N-formylglutamate amidohydrolase [Rhodobacter sp.]
MTYAAYNTIGEDRPGPWLVTCDHASNAVPPTVCGGDLGLPAADMDRHIAYDVGVAGVSRRLAELLNAPVVMSTFSRLVIDPNRGEDDPTLLMQIYDGTVIEGNRHIDDTERERRLNLFYRPYHAEVERLAVLKDPANAVYLPVHSFTPQLNGRTPRPWQVGVLYGYDARFGKALVERLNEEGDLIVGDNEPYSGSLSGDSVDRHALHHGRLNALIEIRHDLIETDEQQTAWAERLAPILEQALARTQV